MGRQDSLGTSDKTGLGHTAGCMGLWGPISMGPGLNDGAYFIGSSLICINGSGIQIEARPISGDIIIEWHAHAIHSNQDPVPSILPICSCDIRKKGIAHQDELASSWHHAC